MNFLRTIIVIFFLAVLLGCDKEDPMPSRVQLLTKNDWKLQAFTSSPAYPITISGTVTNFTDIMAFYRSYNTCFLNQGFHFEMGPESKNYEEGIYTYYEADKACSNQALKDTGRWFFQDGAETILWRANINNTSLLQTSLTVDQITNSKLILISKVRQTTNGPVYSWKRTFVPVN